MSCKVKYIEQSYRSKLPKLADRLTKVYHAIWREVTTGKTFEKFGQGKTVTYLYSPAGSVRNGQQLALANKINEKYGAKVIDGMDTSSKKRKKVIVDVHGIAASELEKLQMEEAQQAEMNRAGLGQEGVGEFYQLGTESQPPKASAQTVSMVKDFLKRIGVNVQEVDDIVVNGVKIDANGIALITQSLVQVTQGNTDTALTEEAMHFAVEIIEQKDPALFNKLLGEVNNYRMYKQVFAEYSQDKSYQTADGKPNIRKIKKEAIAKILTEVVINKNEGSLEKPELTANAETWWSKIINAIKGIFLKSGFDTAAMKILSGEEIGTVADIRAEEGEAYLQKAGPTQESVYNKLRDNHNAIDKKDDGYYVNGVKVPTRVTDIVKNWYDDVAKATMNPDEFKQALNTLKADKGTAGHEDLEHVFSLFVDEDGYLREEPLDDSNYVSHINPNDRELYTLLKENLRERLNSFSKANGGTRFMSEVRVYDPNRIYAGKKGLAGTIDFVAITADGTVNVLDWKFIDLRTERYDDIPWYKIRDWQEQMDQYKRILEKAYGVRPQDFGQTRMIPIKVHYTEGNIKEKILPVLFKLEIGDVDVKKIQQDYLVPVGLEAEKTGNEEIDALVEKLNAVYKKFAEGKALPHERLSKNEQLNALFKAIRQLQMRQNIKPLVHQAKLLVNQVEKTLVDYKDNWEGKDLSEFEDKDISGFLKKLREAKDSVDTYTSLDTDLDFLFDGAELSEEDEKLRKDLTNVSNAARKLEGKLTKTYDKFTSDVAAGTTNTDNLLLPEKIVKGFSKWFGSTTTTQLKSLEVLYKKANKAFGFSAMDTLTETKRLQGYKEAYDKLAQSKGLTIKNYFNLIKKTDSNELIDQFNPEFYKELKAALADKETAYEWVQDNIDIEEYKKAVLEKITSEIERINEKFDNGLGTVDEEEQRSRELFIAKSKYNLSSPESAGWFQADILKKHPKPSKWESNAWKELHKPENRAALDFYDYILERNEEYQKIGYIGKGEARTFLPFVRKGLVEKLIFGGNVTLGEQFLRAISIDEGDVGFGKIDPLTGRPIDKIPTYFTKEVEGDLSTDLFRTMALYNEMALKFKYLSDIEEQALALVTVERNKKAIATSAFSKTQYKNGALQYTPDNNENAKLVEDTVKAIIFGQKYIQSETFDQILGNIGTFGEKINEKLGIKVFPENLSGRQISVNKVIDQFNNFFQIKTLGLNVLSSVSNLYGGKAQSYINAGTYFTKKDYMATEMWVFANKMSGGEDKTKMIGALEYFLPLTDNYNKEIAKTLSLSKLSQENIQEFLMILMRKSDLSVQTVNFFSFLKNAIVQDGKIVNAREYLRTQEGYDEKYAGGAEQRKAFEEKFDKEVEALIAEKGVMKLGVVENGEFKIPGIERKSNSVIELRRKVQQFSKDALGNLSEDDVRMINLNIYGKSFMMFKNWIPRLADVRFGNLKYNSASDAYEWGRMRTLTNLISTDILGAISNLSATIRATEEGVDVMRQMYEKKKADYEEDTGKPLNMTETEFIDLTRKNLKAQMLDLVFLLSMSMLLWGLKANAPDDEEDPRVVNSYKFMIKAVDKLRDELLYFYDPTSVSGLISTGFFPSMSLLDNFATLLKNFGKENFALFTGDEKAAQKNYVIKYLLKTFPVTSQAQGLLPMFYPDLAKELGIKPQSQSGFFR